MPMQVAQGAFVRADSAGGFLGPCEPVDSGVAMATGSRHVKIGEMVMDLLPSGAGRDGVARLAFPPPADPR